MTLGSELNDSIERALGRFADFPEGIDEFREALFARYPSAARVRFGLNSSHLPLEADAVPWYSLGFRSLSPEMRLSRTLHYARGEFFLQDAASMLALAACDADVDEHQAALVCDLCAAPGAKASALLESIGAGFLLANEPIRSRLAPLSYNLARTGNDRYVITSLDPDQLAERLPGIFDLVLVDAPCSGQALLGRGKQSVAALSEKQIEHSAARARRILLAATRLLRPGGKLVFSTCTFAARENEDQFEQLLTQRGISAAPCERLSEYSSGSAACYRLLPHRHQCAGAFASVARCDLDVESESGRLKRKKPSRLPRDVESLFEPMSARLHEAGAVIWAWPEDAPAWVESLAVGGPELAYRTGTTWKPSHAAALRREPLTQQAVELDADAARCFLEGQTIATNGLSGWTVVTSDRQPLGWVKCSVGKGKNHLPAHARW